MLNIDQAVSWIHDDLSHVWSIDFNRVELEQTSYPVSCFSNIRPSISMVRYERSPTVELELLKIEHRFREVAVDIP